MNPDAIKDGGAAYPVAMSEQTHSNQSCAPFQSGMSLRCHFAGLAMQSYLCQRENWSFEQIADAAYGMADAMIAAREA